MAGARVTWSELVSSMPPELRDAWPLIPWRLDRVWRLPCPAQLIALGELTWMFDLPVWSHGGARYQLRPADVRAAPNRFPEHHKQALAADLSYPIDVVRHRGRLATLDGFHRLLKADWEGRPAIAARVLSRADLESTCLGP